MVECVRQPPLTRRSESFADLSRAFDALLEGAGGCVVIEGGPGTGKTQLLQEARLHAQSLDMAVLQSRATDPDRLASLAAPRRFPFGPDGPDQESAEGHGSENVARAKMRLSALARSRPLAILFDDAHQMDEATALALRTLVQEMRSERILWLLSRRPGESPKYAQRTINRLLHQGARSLPLPPLLEAEPISLASPSPHRETGRDLQNTVPGIGIDSFSLGREPFGEPHRERLTGSDGEPLLGFLAENGHLPHSLSSNARWLLQAASVLARPFTVAEIAGLIGQSPIDVLPSLNEAVTVGALVDRETEFSFRSDLFRRSLHGSLAHSVRQALHESVALMRERPRAEPARTGPRVAASADAQLVETLFYLTEQMKSTAPGTAADLILYLLDMLDEKDERRFPVLSDAVRLLATVGRLDQARKLAEETLRGGVPSAQSGYLILALADVFYLNGQAREVVEHTGRALAIPGISETTRVQLQSIRAHGLLEEQNGPDAAEEADATAALAIEGAYRIGEAKSLVCGHSGRCRAALEKGDLEKSVLLGTEAVRIADDSGGQARHRHPRIWLAAALTAADRLDEAQETLFADQAEFDRLGLGWSQPLWHYHLADLRLKGGRLDEAHVEAEMGMRFAKRLTAEPQTARLLTVLARVALHRDELSASRQYVEDAWWLVMDRKQRPPDELAWMTAVVTELDGTSGSGLLPLADVLDSESGRVRLLTRLPHTAASIIRMAKNTGDGALAAAVAATSQTLRVRNPGVRTFSAAALHADSVLRADTALLRAAVAEYQHSPRIMARAAATEELALAEARGGARDEALSLLRSALAVYHACGAKNDVRRVETSLAGLGSRRSAPEPAERSRKQTDAVGLTISELRVARLVAEGLTNREVATRLCLSPHTVDSHLRHSFNKLGVNSRVELTRWVLANDELAMSGLLLRGPD